MKRPNKKCEGVKLKRGDGYKFEATWKVPKAATSKEIKKGKKKVDNVRRFTSLYEKFRIDVIGAKDKADPADLDKVKKETDTNDSCNLDNFVTTGKKRLTRNSFYPHTWQKVNAVVFSVAGHNSAGTGDYVSASYTFGLPRKPEVEFEYDEENGQVKLTVKTNEGKDAQERADTMIKTAVKLGNGTEEVVRDWSAATSTEWTHTFDTSSYAADFSVGETLDFRCWAYARGIRGDNPEKAKAVYGHRLVASPSAATIESVTVTSKDPTGKIRVEVKPGENTDNVKLERRHGESGSWEKVDGAEDNGKCTALYDSYGLAAPELGEYIYYRVESTKDNFSVVGAPFRADSLFTAAATAAASSIHQAPAAVGDDGTSATAKFGWTGEPNQPGKSGVEVSWSQNADAWESTEQPEVFEAEWEDAESTYSGMPHSMSLIIRNLPQSTTTYIRGRKYLEGDNGRTWSGYSNTVSVTPASRPASVTLEAPPTVVRGQAIDLTWTFDGDSEQTEWHVFNEENPNSPIAEGKDSKGAASIPPEAYGDAAAVTLYVLIGAGGDLTQSAESRTVEISEPLECEAHFAATLTAMSSAAFDVYANQPGCMLACSCAAMDNSSPSGPDGGTEQFSGDTVWTAYVSPEWELTTWEATQHAGGRTGAVYHASVPIGGDATFLDGADYRLLVRAVNPGKGLTSGESVADFTVSWSHQAPEPSEDISIDVDIDARSVTLTLVPPDGAAAGDVYDVYRGSATGYERIGSGLALDSVLTDRYAAFGDTEAGYRVALRTVDGDVAWDEYMYELPCPNTRFDWPGGSAEFGWSLDFRDSFKKSFRKSPHKDGTIGGAFNPAIDRSGSYTCKLIKGIDADGIEALLEMASYPNAVYCRRPDGHAFQCNVDIDLSNRDWSMLEELSFSVDAFTLTEQFMLQPGDIAGAMVDETGGE